MLKDAIESFIINAEKLSRFHLKRTVWAVEVGVVSSGVNECENIAAITTLEFKMDEIDSKFSTLCNYKLLQIL